MIDILSLTREPSRKRIRSSLISRSSDGYDGPAHLLQGAPSAPALEVGADSLFECALSVDVGEWSIPDEDEEQVPVVATTNGNLIAVARGKNICVIGPKDDGFVGVEVADSLPSRHDYNSDSLLVSSRDASTAETSTSTSASLDVLAEVEFDISPICAACWGPPLDAATPSRCLVVGDQAGSLHFLLSDTGEVIFSKKLIQVSQGLQCPKFILIQFGLGYVKDALIAAFSNGKVLVFHNLSVEKLVSASGTNISLQNVLKNLVVDQYDLLPKSGCIKMMCVIAVGEGSLEVVHIESSGKLIYSDLQRPSQENDGASVGKSVDVELGTVDNEKFADITILNSISSHFSRLILGLTCDGRLLLLLVDRGAVTIVSSLTLPSSALGYAAHSISFVQKLDCSQADFSVANPQGFMSNEATNRSCCLLITVSFDGGIESVVALCMNNCEAATESCRFFALETAPLYSAGNKAGKRIIFSEDENRATNFETLEIIRNSSPHFILPIVYCFQNSVLRLFRLKRDAEIKSYYFCNSFLSGAISDRNSQYNSLGFCGSFLRKLFLSSNLSELIDYVKTYYEETGCDLQMNQVDSYNDHEQSEADFFNETQANVAFVSYCLLSPCDISLCEDFLNFLLSHIHGSSAFLRSIHKYLDAAAPNDSNFVILRELCAGYASRHLDSLIDPSSATFPPSWRGWVSSISLGRFADSKVVLATLFGNNWPSLSSKSLNHILSIATRAVGLNPSTAHELIDWIEGGVLEALRKSQFVTKSSLLLINSIDHSTREGTVSLQERSLKIESDSHERMAGDRKITRDFENICRSLISLAINLQTSSPEPYVALLCSGYIHHIAIRYCPCLLDEEIVLPNDKTNDPHSSISVSFKKFHSALEIQASVWMTWRYKVSCAEVLSLGINGLASDRLWDISESAPATFYRLLTSDVKPLVENFGGDMDSLLVDWIFSVISSAKISFQQTPNETDVSDSVYFFSLLECASLIKNSNAAAKVIKDLIYLASSQSIVNLTIEARQKVMSSLIDVAERTYPSLPSGMTKDSLFEAVRILKLRRIALSYGVSDFDVRNLRQIKNVVKAIGTSHLSESSIVDCIEFANGWNMPDAEIGFILGHCLVSRALAKERTDISHHYQDMHPLPPTQSHCRTNASYVDPSEARQLLEVAFLQIPTGKIVIAVESAINCITDCIAAIVAKLRDSAPLPKRELQEELCVLCNNAIVILSLFLDSSIPKRAGSGEGNLSPAFTTSADKSLTTNPIKSSNVSFVTESKVLLIALLSVLKRIRLLQLEGIFVSVDEASSTVIRQEIAKKLAVERSNEIVKLGIATGMLNSRCRSLCANLEISPTVFAHFVLDGLLRQNEWRLALIHWRYAGADESYKASPSKQQIDAFNYDANIIMRTCFGVCAALMKLNKNFPNKEKVESIRYIFSFAYQTLKNAILVCSRATIGSLLCSLSISDLVLSVIERVDAGFNASNSSTSGSGEAASCIFVPSSRDGILLPADSVFPMLKAFLSELNFRGVEVDSSGGIVRIQHPGSDAKFADLIDYPSALLKTENHLLASRVLLSSWIQFPRKAQLLHTCFLNLSRKLLGYRDIDTPLATACLAAVPYEMLVRELKQAVPSIQSDFLRLQIVASIGEDLSRLWDEEELLGIFQSLQTNAKWWNILATYGIKVDPKTFQSSIASQRELCIRSIVPDLLSRSGLDLDLAIEYCCQFDIEGSFATLCYIEQILCAPLSCPSDVVWVKLVRRAMTMIDERSLVKVLYEMLPRIHPLDYEKVRFISSWLIQTLTEDANLVDAVSEPQDQHLIMKRLQSYIDLITVLQGVAFGDLSILASFHVYKDDLVHSEYTHRVPLWPLVNETWKILDPILENFPQHGSKLSLLCHALDITADEFHERRVMAVTNLCPSRAADVHGWVFGESFKELSVVLEKITEFRANLSTIAEPKVRLRLWCWAVDRELMMQRWDIAELILTSITGDISSCPEIYAAPDCLSMKLDLYAALARINIRKATLQMMHPLNCPDETHFELEQVISTSDPSNADRTLKGLLMRLNDVAWLIQYKPSNCCGVTSLTSQGSLFCTFDFCNSRISEEVIVYVSRCFRQLSLAFEKSLELDRIIEQPQDATAKGPNDVLGNIRTSLVLKLIYDGFFSFASDSLSTDANEGDINSKSSFGQPWTALLGVQNSILSPTSADERRRSDIFSSFFSAVVLLTCDCNNRASMAESFLGIASNSAKFVRSKRNTARSRFRAVQALRFIYEDWNIFSSTQWRLLYCLSEVQELRLSCSEDTLAEGLGCVVASDVLSIKHSESKNNYRLLIRTLLRDEGHESSVSELCRDILICMSQVECLDFDAWDEVLSHMVLQGHDRAFLDTIIIMRHYNVIGSSNALIPLGPNTSETSLCHFFSSKLLRDALLRSLEKFSTACLQKIDQVRDVIASRLRNDSKKLTGFNTSRVVLRSLVATSPWGFAHWDEAPENLWLCIEQFGLLSRLLVASVTDATRREDKALISEFVRGSCMQLRDAYLKLRFALIGNAEEKQTSGDGNLAPKVLCVICLEESMRLAVSGLTLQNSSEIEFDIVNQLLLTTKFPRAPNTFHPQCCGLWSVTLGFAVFGLSSRVLFEIYDQQVLTGEHSDICSLVEIFMNISMSTKLIGNQGPVSLVSGDIGATETATLLTFQWCFSRENRTRAAAAAFALLCSEARSKLLILLKSLSGSLETIPGISKATLERTFDILNA